MKLTEKDQRNLKGISKAIYIIAKIGRVLMFIIIPFIIIAMIISALVINKFDYQESTIFFDKEPLATLKEDMNGVSISYYDSENNQVYIDMTKNFSSAVSVLNFKKFLDNNSKGMLIFYTQFALVFAFVVIVVAIIILGHLEKLFRNIYNGYTPFTEENTIHIKKMFILMLVNIGISIAFNIIFSLILNQDINYSFSFYGIMEILFVIGIYYIFKYGTILQTKSKMTIYSENNK